MAEEGARTAARHQLRRRYLDCGRRDSIARRRGSYAKTVKEYRGGKTALSPAL